jgi:hypothetical protein
MVSQLVAAGCGGISVADRLEVSGNVQSNGPIAATTTDVGRDLWTASGISGATHVSGDVWLSPGASVTGALRVDGIRVEAPVDVPYPCVCDGSFADDVRAAVTAGAAAADESHAPSTQPGATTFSCGRHAWSGPFPREVRIEGRVALFVRGDIVELGRIEVTPGSALVLFVDGSIRNTGGALAVEVGAGATLDAFVREDFVVDGGAIDFGDDTAAPRSRWYIAGDELGSMGGAIRFVGGFYAPNATVRATGGTIFVIGSLVAARVESGSGGIYVDHPDTIADPGECDTGNPDDACESCADCAGALACVDGTCGDCRTDADCCAPLICVDGACVTELI